MPTFRGVVLSVAGAVLTLILCGCEQQKYPWGRDTVDSFGNGRFQIGRTPTMLVLGDREGGVLVDRVKNWKAKSGCIFLVDDAGKCWKVDYRTGVVTSFEKADTAEAADQELFRKLVAESKPGRT